MRIFFKIFSLGLLMTGLTLSVIAQKTDSLKTVASVYAAAGNYAIYIVNGKLSDKKLDGIDDNDILYVEIVNKISGGYTFTHDKKAIIVLTRQYAIAQYQKKLSTFSKEYKKEIEWQMKYNHNDNGIFYEPMVNDKGKLYTDNERILRLYNIPASKIKKVELSKKETCCGTNVSVFITTKK